jgi:hypothetical protein
VQLVLGLDSELSEDTFLLYKKDSFTDDPAPSAIRTDWFPTVDSLFPSNTDNFLFFRVLRGISQAQFQQSIIVSVEFMDKKTDVAMPIGANWSELNRKLIEMKFFEEGLPPIRVMAAEDGNVRCLVDYTALATGMKRYIEVVPQDQRELADDEKLILVTRAVVDSTDFLRPTGLPLSVKVRQGQTLADLKVEIAGRLGLTDEQLQKTKFLSGIRWVRFAPGGVLKDDIGLWDFARATLFVLVDGKPRTKRRLEQELKIDN